MATILPGSAYPSEKLFPSHEDRKYLGSEMDYTYGDTKQRMTTAAEDTMVLLREAPGHLFPVVKDFLKGNKVVGPVIRT